MEAPYHKRLRARAQRAFGDRTPAEAIAVTRAIIGPRSIPESEKSAQAAMEKLRAGEVPTPQEAAALEFVIRIMRPAPLSLGGRLDPLETSGNLHPPEAIARWERFRNAASAWMGSVGRVDHRDAGHIGTGFLVRADLLATNRHVLDLLTEGTGELREGAAVVRFNCEKGMRQPPDTIARLIRRKAVHPRLDLVLIEVEPSDARVPLRLDLDSAVADGHPVAAIGFPSDGGRTNPCFADAIFKLDYGVRRGAVGEITEPSQPRLYHDCSTLGGNSGSPLISLESHGVIGIHSSGLFIYRNEAVCAAEIQSLLNS